VFAKETEKNDKQKSIIMERTNKKQEMYEYRLLTVFDEEGRGNDYSIEDLLNDGLDLFTKEEKISYLNDIIRDVEHYRDSLIL
jgi:hypothetical protein